MFLVSSSPDTSSASKQICKVLAFLQANETVDFPAKICRHAPEQHVAEVLLAPVEMCLQACWQPLV